MSDCYDIFVTILKSNCIVPTDCELKMKTFPMSIIILMIDRLWLSKSPKTAICKVTFSKCRDFLTIPEPVTRNKLHGGNTITNYLMILSLRNTIYRAEVVVCPIYSI